MDTGRPRGIPWFLVLCDVDDLVGLRRPAAAEPADGRPAASLRRRWLPTADARRSPPQTRRHQVEMATRPLVSPFSNAVTAAAPSAKGNVDPSTGVIFPAATSSFIITSSFAFSLTTNATSF